MTAWTYWRKSICALVSVRVRSLFGSERHEPHIEARGGWSSCRVGDGVRAFGGIPHTHSSRWKCLNLRTWRRKKETCWNGEIHPGYSSRSLAVWTSPSRPDRGNKTLTQSREICSSAAVVRCSTSKHISPVLLQLSVYLQAPTLFIFASPPVTELSFITRAGSLAFQTMPELWNFLLYLYQKEI